MILLANAGLRPEGKPSGKMRMRRLPPSPPDPQVCEPHCYQGLVHTHTSLLGRSGSKSHRPPVLRGGRRNMNAERCMFCERATPGGYETGTLDRAR